MRGAKFSMKILSAMRRRRKPRRDRDTVEEIRGFFHIGGSEFQGMGFCRRCHSHNSVMNRFAKRSRLIKTMTRDPGASVVEIRLNFGNLWGRAKRSGKGRKDKGRVRRIAPSRFPLRVQPFAHCQSVNLLIKEGA